MYSNILENLNLPNFFEDRASLIPTLETIEEVNYFMLSLIPGDEKQYLSSNFPCHSDEDYEIQGD